MAFESAVALAFSSLRRTAMSVGRFYAGRREAVLGQHGSLQAKFTLADDRVLPFPSESNRRRNETHVEPGALMHGGDAPMQAGDNFGALVQDDFGGNNYSAREALLSVDTGV